MTTQDESVYYEDEIDLGKYLRVLIDRWWLIVGMALLAAVSALVVSFLMVPTYEATVHLATTKFKISVELGSQIRTLTEEELATTATGVQALVDRKARQQTFAQLALNPAIAQEVLPQFRERLSAIDEELLDPGNFIENHVESEVAQNTDLIAVTIKLPDAVLAADVANAWGAAQERLINDLYSGTGTQEVEDVGLQRQGAFVVYQGAQSELEAYLADNSIAGLNREIELKQAEIGSLQNTLKEAMSLVSGQELGARRQLLMGYYSDLVALQQLLDDARTLQSQLAAGEPSPAGAFGDSLALIFLRSQAFARLTPEAGAPFSLEVQTPLSASPESVTVDDVSNLMLVLEQRLIRTEERIATLTRTLLDPLQQPLPEGAGSEIRQEIETLTTEMQLLQAQLEAELDHEQELLRQRDLARDTYSTLARKETEVGLAAQTSGTEVRLASPAATPARPAGPRTLLNTAIAGTLGLMLGVSAVFLMEYASRENEAQAQAR